MEGGVNFEVLKKYGIKLSLIGLLLSVMACVRPESATPVDINALAANPCKYVGQEIGTTGYLELQSSQKSTQVFFDPITKQPQYSQVADYTYGLSKGSEKFDPSIKVKRRLTAPPIPGGPSMNATPPERNSKHQVEVTGSIVEDKSQNASEPQKCYLQASYIKNVDSTRSDKP